MSDVSLKLSAKDIYEKDFEKTMVRGYRPQEVDAFLDDIIADYQKMSDLNNEVIKLSEENHKLKKEIEDLRIRVASSRPQDNKSFANQSANQNNNVDILKRISNLEKAVFGK
ncbi:TPA: cell division regulator GpsB [Staphylococcus pseudintermedius]|uniref:cell division regulator GpsB n=1 Tax=Staphylococcus pseudintermedius TaxID=283734 RepID=UPI00288391A2|nr:cell division regulator GpsB [Staphylococcus pseudintermedius]EJA1911531.1 cell division regulator GpsB [Staphylococcus pseudintermedius]EJA1913569.1 cell division regulator GpsB [Staphylococcus pseudintermedius]EKO8616373.1 cell division regulator GpsB [Staphylococcus pseudintermedius]EKO8618438.1 cell division regulator GpsB [Staphylococcus pseudintermedius]MDT0914398.1 cell division regulator GpsB [Staphylococcus pseudintermedius]